MLPQREEGSWRINTSAAFAGKLEGAHLLWEAGREGGWMHEIQTPLREVKFWFSYPKVFICLHDEQLLAFLSREKCWPCYLSSTHTEGFMSRPLNQRLQLHCTSLTWECRSYMWFLSIFWKTQFIHLEFLVLLSIILGGRPIERQCRTWCFSDSKFVYCAFNKNKKILTDVEVGDGGRGGGVWASAFSCTSREKRSHSQHAGVGSSHSNSLSLVYSHRFDCSSSLPFPIYYWWQHKRWEFIRLAISCPMAVAVSQTNWMQQHCIWKPVRQPSYEISQ